jgi:parvulin-like peptidyl-prolyl isomerase
MRLGRWWVIFFAAGACGTGEGDGTLTGEEAERNPDKVVVARIGAERFTLADVLGRIARGGPLAQERFQAPQARLAFLESLVDFEVLLREALARGLNRTPEAARALKGAMAHALWQRGQLPGADRSALTEDRLRSYHAAHRDLFIEPELARVSQILVKLPAGKLLESRQRARARADEIQRELGTRPDAARFERVARLRSEDEGSREKGGDLGSIARGLQTEALPSEAVEAAFQLRPGEVSGPVESPLGVHLLRVASRAPGRPAPFRAVRKQVEARVWSEIRREAMQRLIERLTAAARIEVDAATAQALGETSQYRR